MSALARQSKAFAPDFTLEHPQGGPWIVHGPGDLCGGLFASEDAARKFIREQQAVTACIAANDGWPRARAGAN